MCDFDTFTWGVLVGLTAAGIAMVYKYVKKGLQ